MGQSLRIPAALSGEQGSISSTDMVSEPLVPCDPMILLNTGIARTHNLVLISISGAQIYMQANTYT